MSKVQEGNMNANRNTIGNAVRPGKSREECVLSKTCKAKCENCPQPRLAPRFQRKR